MKKTKDRLSRNCFNPWFQFLAIFCVAAFTMLAIFVADKNHIKIRLNQLGFIKSFFHKEDSSDNILVAAMGNDPKSSVAVQFETCQYFLVVKKSRDQYEYFSNSPASYNVNTVRDFIRLQNIEAVITGTMNIGTYQMLSSSKIEVFTGVTGSVEEALKKFKKHELVSFSRHYFNRRKNTSLNNTGNSNSTRRAEF